MSHDIPGLRGMVILSSKYRNRNIFHLNLWDRQLTVDNEDIGLLGDRQNHLRLPDNLITISSNFKRTKSSSNSDSKTNTAYYQDEHVLRADGARGRELHIVGREQRLEDPPQPLRRKTPDKGKLKATLPDVKTPEDNRILKEKDYDRPDVIAAKKAKLEKFFKFNVIKSVLCSEGRRGDENHVGYQLKSRQSFKNWK